MFNSLKKKVLGLFVPKEWRGLMQIDFTKVLDLIKSMVTPTEGSKFLLSALGIGAIYYMHKSTIATDFSDGMIAAILCLYFIADTVKRRLQSNGKPVDPQPVNGEPKP